MAELVACVDFGSTFTKAALVDLGSGQLLGTAECPTTVGGAHTKSVAGDILDGWSACLDTLAAAEPGARSAEVLACSSAGGGLRIGVVGNEELVTAEAGRRVALSSGGRVVHVAAAPVDRAAIRALRASRPDVVLLVGGTDGGNAEALLTAAGALATARWHGPVVVAGNLDARPEVADLLAGSGTPHVLADNVVPRIGVLAPASARSAIRKMFLEHVIGGKHLSRSRAFAQMVTGATPDVVLTGVELLARGLGDGHPGLGDVVVVDVGGATTDVHSVVEPDAEHAGLSAEVVATTPVNRTVEGDLGVRWSAVSTAAEGAAAGLFTDPDAVSRGAARRQREPSLLPADDRERRIDRELAGAAIELALRRHAGRSQVVYSGQGRVVERTGKDLRDVQLVVGSGGVLRHLGPRHIGRLADLGAGGRRAGTGEAWQLPRSARVVVDRDYVLAPAGLLAPDHPLAAYALVQRLV